MNAPFIPIKSVVSGRRAPLAILVLCLLSIINPAIADDGYRLWLRYDPLPKDYVERARPNLNALVVTGESAVFDAIRSELHSACSGFMGAPVPRADDVERDGAVIVGTPQSSRLIAGLNWDQALKAVGPHGFILRSTTVKGHKAIVIAANTETGCIYGTFHFLRLLGTASPVDNLTVSSSPRFKLRLLNHWDNLNGSIERGYAGKSLWNWAELPDKVDGRLRDYARANASIGINGTVLNNVNSDSRSLNADYLRKTAAIADVFRPYGVRVFLSARFSAPIELGGLKTADPLDAEVAAWWKAKADEIYGLIPDFGGFLVKANSEGQPGPRTYNRDHLDGANMLAAALAPHGGIVMWRAFVYDMKPGYDRAGAAFEQLQPFDGKFATNVLIQVKNGPIDFQPREPFHPMFGAMPKTPLMPELQITQEYLGFANH
ncbi:MAG TPA: alpha-glucuronidase family glycosyl hydrolase, partial [Verrucomicrobiota bacterium]|nr:alpha-glucuronidase family glycosyl hydrolase [Verrucomicrobiota bacterium]